MTRSQEKSLRDLLVTLGAGLASATLVWLNDPETVQFVASKLSVWLGAAAVPVAVSVVTYLRNALRYGA